MVFKIRKEGVFSENILPYNLLTSNMLKRIIFNGISFSRRGFSAKSTLPDVKKIPGSNKPGKKLATPKITLIATDKSISVTDLTEAQNISERRDLKLVKIKDIDTKTQRPVYRLMTSREYHEEDLKARSEKKSNANSHIKGNKLLSISANIGEHDFKTRVKNILKWVEKQYEVKIVINSDGDGQLKKAESIYSTIETEVKGTGRVVQKRVKGSNLKFQVLPIVDKSSNTGAAEQSKRDYSTQCQPEDSPL